MACSSITTFVSSFVSVQKEKQVHKLKGDKSRLEAEVEELEKKIERMSTMRTQVRDKMRSVY